MGLDFAEGSMAIAQWRLDDSEIVSDPPSYRGAAICRNNAVLHCMYPDSVLINPGLKIRLIHIKS